MRLILRLYGLEILAFLLAINVFSWWYFAPFDIFFPNKDEIRILITESPKETLGISVFILFGLIATSSVIIRSIFRLISNGTKRAKNFIWLFIARLSVRMAKITPFQIIQSAFYSVAKKSILSLSNKKIPKDFDSLLRTLRKYTSDGDKSYHIDDAPQIDPDKDILGREVLVDHLCEFISNNNYAALAIAIDGKWGDGKTTVINFVAEKVKDYENIAVVKFNPFSYSRSSSLFEAFFTELRSHPALSFAGADIYNYAIRLMAANFGPLPVEQRSLNEQKSIFLRKIAARGIKIVICIDDVDRLNDKNDVLEVFKLVSEFRDSDCAQNVTFLLSLDLSALEAKEKLGPDFADKYIDKTYRLFNDPDDIDSYVNAGIKQIAEEHSDSYTSWALYKKFRGFFTNVDSEIFHNLRSAKRFLNNFRFNFVTLRDEINPNDIFNITILETFYPNVIRDILSEPHFFIYPQEGDRLNWSQKGTEQFFSEKNYPSSALERIKKLFLPVETALGRQNYHYTAKYFIPEKRLWIEENFKKWAHKRVLESGTSYRAVETFLNRINELSSEDVRDAIANPSFLRICSEMTRNYRGAEAKQVLNSLLKATPSQETDSAQLCEWIFGLIGNTCHKEGAEVEAMQCRIDQYKIVIDEYLERGLTMLVFDFIMYYKSKPWGYSVENTTEIQDMLKRYTAESIEKNGYDIYPQLAVQAVHYYFFSTGDKYPFSLTYIRTIFKDEGRVKSMQDFYKKMHAENPRGGWDKGGEDFLTIVNA